METYDVPLGAACSRLLVGSGSYRALSEELVRRSGRLAVVSDANVERALRGKLFPSAPWLTVPAGEESKSPRSLHSIWSGLLELGLDRSSAVVAVGGGVVGDLAGFAAATYLRGVGFYSVPTSLLAMVDASVGGKVGIDLPEGKNLVGSFYPAATVAVDPSLLETLPEREWSAGMAEVIKHAILSGPELWREVASFGPSDRACAETVNRVVSRAVLVKVAVVKEDPYERSGLRATLNLGHTFGHAIEWCSSYSLSHGSAVALGLLAGLRLSRKLRLLEEDFEESLVAVLRRWNLPTRLDGDDERWRWERVRLALGRDKKNQDGRWCFILPLKLGRVKAVLGPPEEAVREAFSTLTSSEVPG